MSFSVAPGDEKRKDCSREYQRIPPRLFGEREINFIPRKLVLLVEAWLCERYLSKLNDAVKK
jgi:hypothetical protein